MYPRKIPNMVPMHSGPEKIEVRTACANFGQIGDDRPGARFTAFAGTGFDENNPEHCEGSDALRYAICIQQHRDAGDYEAADRARDFASQWYHVGTSADRTVLTPQL
ncbi:hypothetical protein [Mesobacterium pallidum]|uniref:hypothetical protein n=1 Tax=Mesobacterium pallidum TaxID=2872037 RepID=UPI001EE1CDD1|nr:hypothetical protein [Mesobacterium pallidum]